MSLWRRRLRTQASRQVAMGNSQPWPEAEAAAPAPTPPWPLAQQGLLAGFPGPPGRGREACVRRGTGLLARTDFSHTHPSRSFRAAPGRRVTPGREEHSASRLTAPSGPVPPSQPGPHLHLLACWAWACLSAPKLVLPTMASLPAVPGARPWWGLPGHGPAGAPAGGSTGARLGLRWGQPAGLEPSQLS